MKAVTLINCFRVPVGREQQFFALWQQVNKYMKTKPGYLGHRLHRALASEAPNRFINVAQWASEEQFHSAHDEGFRALVSQPAWGEFSHSPFLYEIIHEGRAENATAA